MNVYSLYTLIICLGMIFMWKNYMMEVRGVANSSTLPPLFYEVILCYLEKGSRCTRFLLFSFYNWRPESLMYTFIISTNLITQFWSPCQSKNINNNVKKQWIFSSGLSVLKWTSSKNTPILTMEYSNAFWQRNLVILCLRSVALKYNSWWWKPLHWYFRQGNN